MKKKSLSIFLVFCITLMSFSIGVTSFAEQGVIEHILIEDGTDLLLSISSKSANNADFIDLIKYIETQDEFNGTNKIGSITVLSIASCTNISDISIAFEKLPNITELWASNSSLESLDGIEKWTELEIIYAGNCKISDISGLSGCKEIKDIDLSYNQISDISPLSQCSRLLSLDLENNKISDISSLREFASNDLDRLYLSYNNITDPTPLSSVISRSAYYVVHNNPMADYDNYLKNLNYNYSIEYLPYSNFPSLPFEPEAVDIRNAVEATFDSTDMIYNVKSEGNYVRIYKVLTNGARVTVNVSSYDFITEYKNFYQINKSALESDTAEFDISVSDGSTVKGVVNFVDKVLAFDASKLTIKNSTNTSFDAENSVLTIDSEGTYVRVYKVLANGATVKVNADDYDFITEHDNFYHINKLALKASDLNTASFEMTTGNGDVINTAVNFVAKAPEFEADKLTIKNATNTSFDAENSALTIDSEGTYVRVYKTLANGSTVKVNVDDYDFITEHDNFYHINKLALKTSDLNIASFEMTTDSGDTISTKVNFPNAGVLPLEKFKITNYDSLTIDGNEINIDIVDTKTYSRIFKTVADGTTLTIESDNVYVEEREDCYVLRQRAVGATITMTYGENTYTINLTK